MISLSLIGFLSLFGSSIGSNHGGLECRALNRPVVDEVYPTATVLPKNLLRFYVYFNREMDRESSRDQITIRTESGDVLDGLLLPSRFELWSENARRLTLILDPGRVKTGLSNGQSLDAGFEVGARFTLVIGKGLASIDGCRLSSDFEHEFLITKPDTEIPDPHAWVLTIPSVGSRDPLTVSLRKPLDHLSLAYRIRVQTDAGHVVSGAIALGAHDEQWRFTPTSPWTESAYRLVVDPELEDLAGNRPTGLFDDPSGDSRRRQSSAEALVRVFELNRN
ncbi:MAG: hypothetical protein AAFN07_13850 [Pseudomonadota bacterium]